MAPPDLSFENEIEGLVAGVDEAGRGPWAGPVVAAAVILGKNIPTGLDDSKKLTAKKRENLFSAIQETCVVGIGIVDPAEIDKINILGATRRAMIMAVANLAEIPSGILVDGNQFPKGFPCPAKAIVKGDGKSLSIAAASIIAKVTRDRMMIKLHEEFPHYGWNKNMGYGTKSHIEALKQHGITIHHRKSFAPVAMIESQMELKYG